METVKFKNEIVMKNKLLIIALSCLMINCNGQSKKKDAIMTTEKFDVEAYEKRKEADPWYGNIINLDDGTKIIQSGHGSLRGGAGELITPPKPVFYKIKKRYHRTTNTIEFKGKVLGDMFIDIWQYFDEQGKLVKEVNENAKFGKHHYNDALQFLEKEGWITIKTGEGRERFSLGFENDIWYITIIGNMWNGYLETYYEVDAKTMKILKKEEVQRGEE